MFFARLSRRPRVLLFLLALAFVLWGLVYRPGSLALLLSRRQHPGTNDSLRVILDTVHGSLSRAVNLSIANAQPSASLLHSWPSAHHARPVSASAEHALLCDLLSGKAIYVVGPQPTSYLLHDLLLHSLHSPDTCNGPSLCSFHPLCSDDIHPPPSSDPSRRLGSLKPNDIIGSNTSLLRYISSDTLYPSPDPFHPRFLGPVVDEQTGVRVTDARWTAQVSRNAGVLVLNRGPVPAPAWSYGSHRLSWLDDLLRSSPSELKPSSDLEKIILAALHTTLTTYLPSLLTHLSALRTADGFPPILGTRPVIWHASWYMLPPSCYSRARSGSGFGSGPHLGATEGSDLLPPELTYLLAIIDGVICDPWNVYYNIQVYLHSLILPHILPSYNISYLPLPLPSAPNNSTCPNPTLGPAPTPKERDCLRPKLESERGRRLGAGFIKGLSRALEIWEGERVQVQVQAKGGGKETEGG
ncbi:uncharacterized protein STEHIDRAFT_158799 [Stereum hirsutum FP-91666 SS1]|uniref:uncharacterized protein n=1 Tax=Stereum hirsutum (strain FP-91666) TaxID=721885 RepID=UPI000444A7D6|nr:uncharacterized protein STEHIDRAFT_158799 [Stereum hirsutum FP-91666 SS1]EIM85105.1 hypothetical protein STEHIDRAFT_158799 [Stereum hirsutum FP-91666 SS1]